MTLNVGKTDRMMRWIVAIGMVVESLTQPFSLPFQIIISIMAIYMFITGLMRFCPLYLLFHINTTSNTNG